MIEMIKPFQNFLNFSVNTVLSWVMKFILFGCLLYSLKIGNVIFAFAAALALLVSLLPQILHYNYRITLPWEIDLLVTFMLVMHILFGELFHFHNTVFLFDKLMHFFGTATVAIIGFMFVYAIHDLTEINLTLGSIGFFTVIFAVAVGTFWEIAEFAVDQIFGLVTQNGLEDTMWDLIWDLGGGLCVAIIGVFYVKYLEQTSKEKFHRSIRKAFHKETIRSS